MTANRKEVQFPNIEITSVNIYKIVEKTSTKISLFDVTESRQNPDAFSGISIQEIILDEDMFGGAVTGFITINDSVGLLEQLNFGIHDSIEFILTSPTETKQLKFVILDYEIKDNLAKREIHGPSGIKTTITLRFTSDAFMYRDFDVQTAMSNFIGKISKGSKDNDNFQNIDYPNLVDLEEEKQMKGFLQELIREVSGEEKDAKGDGLFGGSPQSGKKLIADDTYNDIWIKPNPVMYPFSKLSSTAKPFELFNYVCEYACWKEDPNSVNFFFWEDLDNWNFRCISSLATEKTKHYYEINEYENFNRSIVSMEVINDSRIMELIDKGCFFSEYIRVKPNWSNPYRHVSDTGNSLTRKNITFNYKEDIKTTLTGYKIATDSVLDNIKNNKLLNYNNLRLTDNLFGFYSTPYNSSYYNFNWWNYYNFNTDGFTGERIQRLESINTPEDLIQRKPEISEISRLENEYWQSQFDFCELPGALLRIIYKEIKYPLIKARYDYSKLKNLKNSWIAYRKNVCCERAIPSNFFAILTEADKIHGSTGGVLENDSGGIYAYKWAEVEFWPKEQILLNKNNELQVEIWKKNKKIIEFEDSNFPFVFVMPSYALVGTNSEKYTVPKGITTTVSGVYNTPDNRAYNLNEILNSVAPTKFEDGHQTLLMNSGVTDILGTIVDRKTVTNYPSKTIMMPVGKFRIISETCPDFSEPGNKISSAQENNNSGGFYFGGRIVQMTAIPKEILQSFVSFYPGTTAGITGMNDYLFVFDTINAHDGLCNDENCT